MSTSRANLIQSAVNFLRDPAVQNAPLQKRVSFLESKGLTSEEIEEALKQAKGGTPASQTEGSQAAVVTAAAPPGQQVVYAVPPPVPRMDWRDYFIAAVIIGGVGYAIIAVIKKYVAPLLGTPTAAELERDKRALTSQFDTATETLDTVKSDTQVARKHVEEQSAVIKQSLENLDTLLKAVKDNDEKREVAIKSLKEEIDAIKDLLPKLLEKSKESQSQQMNDLQQELKSLKSLLLNRGSVAVQAPGSATKRTSNITSIPQKGATVSIPSWQMKENNGIGGGSKPTEQEDEMNYAAAGTNGALTENTVE